MTEILHMAHALSRHAGARQTVIARNVANADTPGYRAQDLAPFADSYNAPDTLALRTTRSGHIGGAGSALALRIQAVDGPADPNGNTVSLPEEMLRAADTMRAHDLSLAVYRTALGVLRTSLGRPR
ncbi:FlgB family protein [Rhodovulum adriaticum]|uniref:Flagellar basal-body rod protein FlgB n=1 Tax=Rhodovulum adriaticum TaxID=35804 RepID=A0A4R2NZC2_RHOAD|nr:FlgB family protein [Rhodovulum adriaticum]MBK1634762.1 flagellar basal body rod protein FlgB [Rhodovulum adriaticum]TCP27663.1 flagellar basal-body rod protein FlgB [Rhodovulum adriaticum]